MTRLTASPCSRCSLEGSSSLYLPISPYISPYLAPWRARPPYISLYLPTPPYISPYLAPWRARRTPPASSRTPVTKNHALEKEIESTPSRVLSCLHHAHRLIVPADKVKRHGKGEPDQSIDLIE